MNSLLLFIVVLVQQTMGYNVDSPISVTLQTITTSLNYLSNGTLDVPLNKNSDLVQQYANYLYILTRRTWDPTDTAGYPMFTVYKKLALTPFTHTIIVFADI